MSDSVCQAQLSRSLFLLFLAAGIVGLAAGPEDVSAVAMAQELSGTSQTIAGNGTVSNDASSGPGQEVSIDQPFGIEVLRDGRILVTEVGRHRIWQIDPRDHSCSVLIGSGIAGYTGDGGPALEARLNEPYEIREDPDGNLYWVEMRNHIVRRWDSTTQTISTIAGTGEPGFSGDGLLATEARLNQPHSLVLDLDRNRIYVADIGNHRIREIDLQTGVISTLAGNGELKLPLEGQLAHENPVLGPRALAIDAGRLWVALREGHSLWTLDLNDRRWHHEAGTGERGFQAFAVDALEAKFDGPKGIALTPEGRIAIVDTENHAIRLYDPVTGRVSTLSGAGPASRGYGEGSTPESIRMNRPHGIAIDSQGRIYVSDSENHRVRLLPLP